MNLLKKVFGQIFIPEEVKVEVVDRGKDLGERDAYLIEEAINDGWIKVLKSEILEIPIKLELGDCRPFPRKEIRCKRDFSR